jgi:hypothetical protein
LVKLNPVMAISLLRIEGNSHFLSRHRMALPEDKSYLLRCRNSPMAKSFSSR